MFVEAGRLGRSSRWPDRVTARSVRRHKCQYVHSGTQISALCASADVVGKREKGLIVHLLHQWMPVVLR